MLDCLHPVATQAVQPAVLSFLSCSFGLAPLFGFVWPPAHTRTAVARSPSFSAFCPVLRCPSQNAALNPIEQHSTPQQQPRYCPPRTTEVLVSSASSKSKQHIHLPLFSLLPGHFPCPVAIPGHQARTPMRCLGEEGGICNMVRLNMVRASLLVGRMANEGQQSV